MKSFLNIIMLPLSVLYHVIISVRNYFYDIRLFKTTKLPCKVISVGNITVGGTGKTPTVIALTEFLLQQNKKVAILSRGYGRRTRGTQIVTNGKNLDSTWETVGDEPLLMAKRISGVPIVVDENRVRGGQLLIEKFDPEIIILDDGFQHRKLYRDLDLVLIKSTNQFFYKSNFSFNFREGWRSLQRAHLLLLTKTNLTPPSRPLIQKLNSYNKPLFEVKIEPNSYLIDSKGGKIDISRFKNKRALLFSGVGDPGSFKNIVKSLNINVVDTIIFKDHATYTVSALNSIQQRFTKCGAEIIITTEKDSIKLDQDNKLIYVLPISIGLPSSLTERIIKLLNQ